MVQTYACCWGKRHSLKSLYDARKNGWACLPGVPRSFLCPLPRSAGLRSLRFVWFDFSFLVQKVRVTSTRKLNRGETENDGERSRGRNEAQKKKHTKTTEWRCYQVNFRWLIFHHYGSCRTTEISEGNPNRYQLKIPESSDQPESYNCINSKSTTRTLHVRSN